MHWSPVCHWSHQGIFAFGPYYFLNSGLYPNPSLKEMVATGDVAPDSGGATFTGFLDLTSVGVDVPFIATLSDGRQGIYIYGLPLDGSASPGGLKAIEVDDQLDGKIVADFGLSPESCGTGQTVAYAFHVDFTDGSQGIYYFAVPEPAYLEFLALPLFVFARRRRRGSGQHPRQRPICESLDLTKSNASFYMDSASL